MSETESRDFSGVPLPSITAVVPSTMEGTDTNPTLSQDKPEKVVNPTGPPADGHSEPEVKDSACSKGANSANTVSIMTGDTVDHPFSPKTAISPRRYQYNPKDDKEFHHWITKAHTCVRQGYPSTSSDKEKDVERLSEMVSHMAHLLAATGVGRDTTARALAYMKGPDKPDPKQALNEAKNDRRKKKDARRVPSGGSTKSAKVDNAGESSSNKETTLTAPNTSESSDPCNTTTEYPANPRDQKSCSTVVQAIENTNKGDQTSNTSGTNKNKKTFGRRRWWPHRSRRGNKDQNKDKENESQAQNGDSGQQEPLTNASVAEAFAKSAANLNASTESPLSTATNAAAPAA